MTTIRVILAPIMKSDGTRCLVFVDVADEAGQPLGMTAPDALGWTADGDHEALIIDLDKLPAVVVPH